MFKKLRRQIIIIELCAFLIITLTIVCVINFTYSNQITQSAHQVLELLADYNGSFPDVDTSAFDEQQMQSATDDTAIRIIAKKYNFGFGTKLTDETQYMTRYFTAIVDSNGKIINSDLSHIAATTNEEVKTYVDKAFKNRSDESSADKYRYLKLENNNGTTTIYFVDCEAQISYLEYLTQISIIVAIMCMFLASLFVWVLSGKIIKPLQNNIEMQKRFITDASHELKTPLAAIQANADVLELTTGKSETIDKIKRQTKQLGGLVNEMLTLSRMDSSDINKTELTKTDFSAIVKATLSEFEPVAQSKNKKLTVEIAPNIYVKGVTNELARLVSVLCDNAIKYCSDNGEITVTLATSMHYAKLQISNTSEEFKSNDIEHLFDRFYRTDSSRSKETGGYGIGLSIAQAVVERHKGKISAHNGNGTVYFTVEIPVM